MGDRDTLTSDALIVCEGTSDEAFFHAFIEQRGLPRFCVRVTGDAGKGHGNEHFGDFLEALVSWKQFRDIRNIILVSDNDANATDSFRRVRDQVASVRPERDPPVTFVTPQRACQTAQGTPAVTILMLPWRGRRGCLETLCLEAARSATARSPAVADCVERFSVCSGTDRWPYSKLSKMKLQSMLVAQNRRNPSVGLSNVWRDRTGLIPLDHGCFDDLFYYLSQFLVASLPVPQQT